MSKYGVSIKWLAVTCFEIKTQGVTVVTDPFVTECQGTALDWQAIENCDIISLSHAHYDHITDIPRLLTKFNPKILCGEQTALPLARWLDCNPTYVYPMYPDTQLDFGNIKIRSLYGRHSNQGKNINRLVRDITVNAICKADPGIAALQELGSFEYRNFLFTLPNGTKILVWGNDPTTEQINICKELKPDIAIIQRSGDEGGMKSKAEFAAAIGCKVVIPHHHDFWQPDDTPSLCTFEEEYLRLVPDGKFIYPKHNEWIDL